VNGSLQTVIMLSVLFGCRSNVIVSRYGLLWRASGKRRRDVGKSFASHRPGEVVRRDIGTAVSEPVVIHMESDWMVINKPPGWHSSSIKNSASTAPSIEEWLDSRRHRATQEEVPEGGLVHRLDQGTSGCIVAARNVGEASSMAVILK